MKKRFKRKKFTSEEKFKYHNDRYLSCGKYGLDFGDSKHLYSAGFRDGFYHMDNSSGVKSEFGKRSANSYSIGNRRGKAAALDYFKRTGKQPNDLK